MAGHVEVACALVGVSALGVIGWFIKARLDEKQDTTPRPKPERQTSRRR
jgi:Na+/glutamate symporter